MKQSSIIKDGEEELYSYGLFVLLSQLFFVIVVVFFGVAFSCIVESLVFYLLFRFIRIYAGGFHAKTETRCEIMSVLSILLCIVAIRLTNIVNVKELLLVLSTVSLVTIIAFCPLDTPEKPLTSNEFRTFRKISLLILLIISVLVVISYIFELKRIFAPSCLSLILESVLISAGKIKQLHSKKHAEQ